MQAIAASARPDKVTCRVYKLVDVSCALEDFMRPTSPRFRAARAAFFAWSAVAMASAAACARNDTPQVSAAVGSGGGDPCPSGCENPFSSGAGGFDQSSTIGSGVAVCTAASASKDCDDGDLCTKDVCLFGTCAHPPSSACEGPGAFVFASGYPSSGAPQETSVAANLDGTTIFATVFSGKIVVDGTLLSSVGGTALLVRKLDPAGEMIWQHVFGGSGGIGSLALATDSAGAVVLTGSFVDDAGTPLDFGGAPLGTQSNTVTTFLVKLDANGNQLWSRIYPGAVSSFATSVAIDAKGTIAISGSMSGALYFGGALVGGTSAHDTFVAEIDSAGTPLWGRAFVDENVNDVYFGHRLAFDSSGDLVVAGSFLGKADVGGGPIGAAGVPGSFVTRLDPLGATVWSDVFPSSSGAMKVQGAAVDGKGNILVSGAFAGAVAFGVGVHQTTGKGDQDLFVVQLDANGKPTWSRSFGDAAGQLFCTLATDASNNVLLAGAFQGQLTIGTGHLATTGEFDLDVFVGALDTLGNGLWSRRFGDSQNQAAGALAVDGAGSPIIAGTFLGAIDFGGGAITSGQPVWGSFVAKLAP
jgi:hypothetical protein